ncbi:MAG: hypothetical protein U0836_16225 [Pirellulales bacterium]
MKGSFLGLALVAATVLLLSGCAAGLANRAGAEDYTAAVAAEAAAVSLEAAAPAPAPAAARVVKDDAADTLILPAVLSKSAGPASCACGDNCQCAAELVKLKEYQREAEAFFVAHGYRSTAGFDLGETVTVAPGSCANGQCAVSSQPRRGWFGGRGLFGRRR